MKKQPQKGHAPQLPPKDSQSSKGQLNESKPAQPSATGQQVKGQHLKSQNSSQPQAQAKQPLASIGKRLMPDDASNSAEKRRKSEPLDSLTERPTISSHSPNSVSTGGMRPVARLGGPQGFQLRDEEENKPQEHKKPAIPARTMKHR